MTLLDIKRKYENIKQSTISFGHWKDMDGFVSELLVLAAKPAVTCNCGNCIWCTRYGSSGL